MNRNGPDGVVYCCQTCYTVKYEKENPGDTLTTSEFKKALGKVLGEELHIRQCHGRQRAFEVDQGQV